jgi:outer membrane protein assembly factor BamE (lipoprotein component of BamABCDE complex)
MRFVSVSFFLGVFLLCSGCEKTVINHGYVPEGVDFKSIKVGDSTSKIISTFGSPTMTSSIPSADGSFKWFYVYKRTEKVSFLDPKVVAQKTFIISFSKAGTVSSVSESAYEQSISTVGGKTKTEGKTGSVLSETFGGLGKYMKRYTDKDKDKK